MLGTRYALRASRGSWRLIYPALILAAGQAHAPFAAQAPLGTQEPREARVRRADQASGRQPATFDLDEATLADLQQRMEAGRDTSRSLVEKYLRRIDAIDRSGPMLHSVIEVNPDALAIADRLDGERKAGGGAAPCTAYRFSSRTTSRRLTE